MTSATVKVEKATSDLLLSPDWTLNIDICDSVSSDYGQAKDVIKAIKKRLHHKSSKVQFFTLTLLETLMKNCGDYVHQQVNEREILNDMVKIVKKKSDVQVTDKILVLLDSWKEAFGGPAGRYPQYYWAYSELKAYGVVFPERSRDDVPIITPPATHPTATDHPVAQHSPSQFPAPTPQILYALPGNQQLGYGLPQPSYGSPQAGYGMPQSGNGTRLRGYGAHPFYGMPVNNPHPSYGMPVNASIRLDEAMASEMANLSLSDLDRMRSVMELLNEMLKAVNPTDREAVKDEVISDLVSQCRLNEKKLMACINSTSDEKLLEESLQLNDKLQTLLAKHDAIASGSPQPSPAEREEPPAVPVQTSVAVATTSQVVTDVVGDKEEEEEEDDEFAQLARRKTKMKSVSKESSTISQPSTSTVPEPSTSVVSNPLHLPAPLAPVKTSTKDDDMVNLLSLSLAPQSTSPLTPTTPTLTPFSTSNQNPSPITSLGQNYAEWAPHQPQENTLTKTSSPITSPVNQGNNYSMSWAPPQMQLQPQESDVTTSYPPPPWEADTPADVGSTTTVLSTAVQYPINSPPHGMRPVQQSGSVGLWQSGSGAAPRPSYISSNTFFGDLVELRNTDGTVRTTGGVPASTGSPSYSMNSGNK